MSSDESVCSEVGVTRTARGLARFQVDVAHRGLKKYRRIKGDDRYLVMRKAEAQMLEWDEAWRKRKAVAKERSLRTAAAGAAKDRTQEAQAAIAAVENILAKTLGRDDMVDWDTLRDHSQFTRPRVFEKPKPTPPLLADQPPKPRPLDPRLGFLEWLISSRKEKKLQAARQQYQARLLRWQEECAQIVETTRIAREQYEASVRRWQQEEAAFVKKWEAEREQFLRRQQKRNEAVDKRMAAYAGCEPGAIVDYCDLVLSRSEYPDSFPHDYDLDYIPETKTLVVEYRLPAPEAMPKVKEVKYIGSRDEFKEVLLTEKQRNDLYDSAVYQIALRTLHELFEADAVGGLEAIVFNGWVTSVDVRTGQEATACIVSVQAKRGEFMAINLAKVVPKACFKALKGVGSSELHGLAAVAPLLQMSREDKRFVQSREVVTALDEGYNLAAMDWQDFEHLVRELFEKEFARAGGEVKITRASRDGGVDAVAFDPDPIRGGKIVIQAKRYTNVVGVGAVRDLYGTVVNEGATKGILVSTSEYGPDAYEFAKDKPLTLLNGSNLLHLLQKHGHKARIDLQEARIILAEKEKEQNARP